MGVCHSKLRLLERPIKAAKTYTDFYSKYNISAFNEKTKFFWCCKLLRLFSGDLLAIDVAQLHKRFDVISTKCLTKIVVRITCNY